MNWYHRGEGRYVEYGTSFKASQTFGFKRSLTDTIYNMNLEHLVAGRRDGVRDARRRRRPHRRHDVPDVPRPPPPRGDERHRAHAARLDGLPPRRLRARASSSTPTSSPRARPAAAAQLGLPGQRDQHAGCVGAHLVEHDLFDFLLLSLPDNDTHSHRNGPFAQVSSIAAADKQLERLMHAGGRPRGVPRGPRDDRLLGPLAVAGRARDRPLQGVRRLRARAAACRPAVRRDGEPPEIAVCPSSRSAQVYVLDRERRAELIPRIERTALRARGRRPRRCT